MPCSGAYASAEEYNDLMCAGLDLDDAETVATIENALEIAASDVHAALASVGACDCTLASWAETYLKKLNIIDAAVIQNCPCGNQLDADEKRIMLEWLNGQFQLIREGKIEVCDGYTGADFPAIAIAQRGLTPAISANIAVNEILRSRST